MTFREFSRWLRNPHGLPSFLSFAKRSERLLDVGCGNDSAYHIKRGFPNLHYTGLDIQDYKLNKPNMANVYIKVTPEEFANKIQEWNEKFDIVVSSHNLEHCYDREKTLLAMIDALAPNGRIFLAFPCQESIKFPARKGTLNYFDDITHVDTPPDFDWILGVLEKKGIQVMKAIRRNRPFLYFICGLFEERTSAREAIVKKHTWQFYGFESIIWAKKTKTS